MTEADLRTIINELNIDEATKLILSFMENGEQISFRGRIEFFNNGSPAIRDERVGIRIVKIKGGSDMPYVGGLALTDLISIEAA